MKTKLFATLAIGAIAAAMLVGCDPKPPENDTATPPTKTDSVTKAPTPTPPAKSDSAAPAPDATGKDVKPDAPKSK